LQVESDIFPANIIKIGTRQSSIVKTNKKAKLTLR